MPVEVIMPKVDMDMATGTLAAWHVAEGESVEKGAPLFDIETDKAAMEVESPASGRLHFVTAKPGSVVAVGAPVAWIYAEGEVLGDAPGGAVSSPSAFAEPDAVLPEAADTPASAPAPVDQPELVADDIRATPAARRLARENGLSVADVLGTGPKGRVQCADVEDACARRAKTPTAARETPQAPESPAATPSRFTSARPEAPDTLHVSRRKGSGTPLLMIHGFAADSTGWAPLERALPADLALIRLDLPGHGRSGPREAAKFSQLARLVVEAFDGLGVEKVHLLGHSLGGALALALADIRPRQIATLSLISPAGLGPEIDGAAISGIARASRSESLAPWLKRLTAHPDAISWDFVKAAMLARIDPALRDWQSDLAGTLFPDGVQGFDLHAALGRIEMPSAIVWGRDDKIIPWKHALAAKGEVALHLLHGVGHIPHVERPELVAAIVARLAGRSKDSD